MFILYHSQRNDPPVARRPGVGVIDAGRSLSPQAGRNQIAGAVVMGIGMALLQHTDHDPRNGAHINSNLAAELNMISFAMPGSKRLRSKDGR